MLSKQSLHMPLGISKLPSYIKNKLSFARNNPNYFYADGLSIFVGPQGSGKTLSAVQYTLNLLKLYPKAILVTNIALSDYPIVEYSDYCIQHELNENGQSYLEYISNNRVYPFNNDDDLLLYRNDQFGVIFLIDEIHLYFNSLESKNINLEKMAVFSQQRKQRLHVVATSQVFGRMAKPLREQFANVVKCRCYFNCLQFNKLIDKDSIEDNTNDMKLKGKSIARFYWFHSYDYYNSYDTYYVVERTKFISNELKKGDIYASELSTSD